MAYSLVTSTSKTGAVTTDAINTAGANLIVVAVASDNGTAPTDNKSNTYTLCNDRVQGFSELAIFYCAAPTVGAGHTFTQTQTYGAIFVLAFSGASATPLDALDVDNGTAAGASLSPGSGTPSQANEVVVTAINIGGANLSITVDGGFTALTIPGVSGVNYGGGIAYLIQTSAAAASPTWSWTGVNEAAAAMNAFKVAASSPTAGTQGYLTLLGVGK